MFKYAVFGRQFQFRKNESLIVSEKFVDLPAVGAVHDDVPVLFHDGPLAEIMDQRVGIVKRNLILVFPEQAP